MRRKMSGEGDHVNFLDGRNRYSKSDKAFWSACFFVGKVLCVFLFSWRIQRGIMMLKRKDRGGWIGKKNDGPMLVCMCNGGNGLGMQGK